MTKRYSQKWQWYFILLLENVPLIIPREESSRRTGNRRVATAMFHAAAALAMGGTILYTRPMGR